MTTRIHASEMSRLAGSSFRFSMLMSLASLMLFAMPRGLRAADWDIFTPVVLTDTTKVMYGNVTVHNGGSLTLDNATLKMNVFEDGEYEIQVKSGGGRHIGNGSVITDGDADNDALPPDSPENHRFLFSVDDGAQFEMRDSEVHECLMH